MDMFPSSSREASSARNGNDSNIDSATTAAAGQLIDLRDKIDNARCYARNEASGFPMSNLFIGDSRLGCKSDSDEQLILHIAFNEFVKVRTNCRTQCCVISAIILK
jgi:PITH domain